MVIGREGRNKNFNFRNHKVSFKQKKAVWNSRYTLGPGNTVGGVSGKKKNKTNLMHNFAEPILLL